MYSAICYSCEYRVVYFGHIGEQSLGEPLSAAVIYDRFQGKPAWRDRIDLKRAV